MAKSVHAANALQDIEKYLEAHIHEPFVISWSTELNQVPPVSPVYTCYLILYTRNRPDEVLVVKHRDFDTLTYELVRLYEQYIKQRADEVVKPKNQLKQAAASRADSRIRSHDRLLGTTGQRTKGATKKSRKKTH